MYLYHLHVHMHKVVMDYPFCRDITTSFPSFAMREEAGDDADIDESLINAKNGTN